MCFRVDEMRLKASREMETNTFAPKWDGNLMDAQNYYILMQFFIDSFILNSLIVQEVLAIVFTFLIIVITV